MFESSDFNAELLFGSNAPFEVPSGLTIDILDPLFTLPQADTTIMKGDIPAMLVQLSGTTGETRMLVAAGEGKVSDSSAGCNP